jgi:hypothetical protein
MADEIFERYEGDELGTPEPRPYLPRKNARSSRRSDRTREISATSRRSSRVCSFPPPSPRWICCR